MKHLANGRLVMIVAAGTLAFCASTAHAGLFSFGTDAAQTEAAAPPPEPEAKEPVRRTRQVRHRRHRTERSARSRKDEAKSTERTADRNANKQDPKPAGAPTMPPSVADANAQMLPATAADLAAAMATTPSPAAAAPAASEAAPLPESAAEAAAPGTAPQTDIVASDELNDLDKAAAERPVQKVLRPLSSSVQSASAQDEDVWGRTSLIGKIFIAFGGMLTLASAARMFIA